jgi:hypothetical protein
MLSFAAVIVVGQEGVFTAVVVPVRFAVAAPIRPVVVVVKGGVFKAVGIIKIFYAFAGRRKVLAAAGLGFGLRLFAFAAAGLGFGLRLFAFAAAGLGLGLRFLAFAAGLDGTFAAYFALFAAAAAAVIVGKTHGFKPPILCSCIYADVYMI